MTDCDHRAVSRCAENCACDPEQPHRCRSESCYLCFVNLKWDKEKSNYVEAP
jgi:hypothetical protein